MALILSNFEIGLKKSTVKKILLFMSLFACGLSFAQFNLEHAYVNDAVNRVKFGFSGEKYYVYNKQETRVDLYHADHVFWKSIDLPMPVQSSIVAIFNVSDATFNTDTDIEIAYSYYQNGFAGGTYYCNVIGENGSVLLSLQDCNSMQIDQIQGFAPKLIANGLQKKIYALPGLALEHDYTDSQWGLLYRIKLENSGEKYYCLNSVTNQMQLFNADHTPWKTVNMPLPDGYSYTNVGFVSETAVNADAQLEIGYSYYAVVGGNLVHEGKIINEAGSNLLLLIANYAINLSTIAGLSNKVIARNAHQTIVYGLPSLTQEQAYNGAAVRTLLDVSGEKYYTFTENEIQLYNSNHSLWKAVSLPLPENYYVNSISHLSERQIDQDDQLEIGYITSETEFLEFPVRQGRVSRENGDLLLSVPHATFLYLDQINGLEDKLIAVINQQPMMTTNTGGEVYSIDDTMAVVGFAGNEVVLYPNPVSSVLHFQGTAPIVEVGIYNVLGELVLQQSGNDLKQIPMDGLPAGSYMVCLTDSNRVKSFRKIMVGR